jgi:hypothetical protein
MFVMSIPLEILRSALDDMELDDSKGRSGDFQTDYSTIRIRFENRRSFLF